MSSSLSRMLFRRTKLTHELLGHYFFETPPGVSEKVVAATTAGRVVGFKAPASTISLDSSHEQDVFTFRGVPFAVAERNTAPKPIEEYPWSGDRDCLKFGPACPQAPYGLGRILAEGLLPAFVETVFPPLPSNQSYSFGTFSEKDCLNANIYTTSLEPGAKRKVLVWIHGGAYVAGSNAESGLYDATQLAAEIDACIIVVNYRLHMFGFLHFPDHGITNLATRDVVAALKWVKHNCSSFGGDPNNVTIIGESAGGMAIGTLLGSPEAKGLFHKAVPMSCGTLKHSYHPHGYKAIFDVIEQSLSKELQGQPLTPSSFAAIPEEKVSARMIKMLLERQTEKILQSNKIMFGEYQDGQVVPLLGPHDGLHHSAGIPILAGTIRDEWKFFQHVVPTMASPRKRGKVVKEVIPFLRMYFETTILDDGPDSAKKWEAIAQDLYDVIESSRSDRGLSVDPASVFESIATLLVFGMHQYSLVRDTGGYHYCIELDDEPFGSCHVRDAVLLFKGGSTSVMPAQNQQFIGDWKDSSHPVVEVSNYFVQAVKSFAETGQPSIPGAEAWETFPSTMDIKAGGCTSKSIESPEFAFMEGLETRVVQEFEEVDGAMIF